MRSELRSAVLATVMLALAACGADAPQALGTLEWDRVTLPAPVAEKKVTAEYRDGVLVLHLVKEIAVPATKILIK